MKENIIEFLTVSMKLILLIKRIKLFVRADTINKLWSSLCTPILTVITKITSWYQKVRTMNMQ